jgi:hypothetical protein
MKWFKRLATVSVMLVCSMFSMIVFAQMEGGTLGFGGILEPKADNKQHWACWNQPGAWPPELSSYYNWWQGYGWFVTGLRIRIYVPNACHPLDDMFMRDNLTDGNVFGATACNNIVNDPVDGWICLQATVRINPTTIANRASAWGFTYSEAAYHVWCHEIGHSYGIWHDYHPNSCTSTDVLPNEPNTYSVTEYNLMQTYIPL